MANPSPMTFYGRPIKPVGLGFTLSLICLVALNATNSDEFGPSVLGDVLGVMSGLVALLITYAWWRRSQRWYEIGLLLALTLWLQRSVFIGFTVGFWNRGVLLGLSWGVMAATSYYLEVADDSPSRFRPGRARRGDG